MNLEPEQNLKPYKKKSYQDWTFDHHGSMIEQVIISGSQNEGKIVHLVLSLADSSRKEYDREIKSQREEEDGGHHAIPFLDFILLLKDFCSVLDDTQ